MVEDRDKNLIYNEILEWDKPTEGNETRPVAVLLLRLAAYLSQLRFLDALARHTILRRAAEICADVANMGDPGHIVIRDFRYVGITHLTKAYDLKTGELLEELPIGISTFAIDLLNLLNNKPEESQA